MSETNDEEPQQTAPQDPGGSRKVDARGQGDPDDGRHGATPYGDDPGRVDGDTGDEGTASESTGSESTGSDTPSEPPD